ncbi:MAG: hypothetical protein FJ125_02425, partial [Deltaproteobacteria bacterium]|nr:hypothetical protein [Deltaproteobacteria bacterium]
YPNECWRLGYGTPLAHPGPCQGSVECGFGEQCEPLQACDVQGCARDAERECLDVPFLCPAGREPVCGCDGQTYDNDCKRLKADVAKAHDGECAVSDRCGPGAPPCVQNRACDLRGCGDQTTGQCVEPQPFCPLDLQPVCGCDGRTYGNNCWRVHQGAALDHPGACRPLPCGDLAEGCVEGEICDVIGCGAGAQAHCVLFPDCSENVEISCGCDGVTYLRDCTRTQQGVARERMGACMDQPCTALQGCPAGAICNIRHCDVGGQGICVALPESCPEVHVPVCSCDGRLFANDCERIRAGAPLGRPTCF